MVKKRILVVDDELSMFEILSDKLSGIFRKLSSRWRLSEKDTDEGLREARFTLLEADVNFRVVKDFTARVRDCLPNNLRKGLSTCGKVTK